MFYKIFHKISLKDFKKKKLKKKYNSIKLKNLFIVFIIEKFRKEIEIYFKNNSLE